MSTLYELSADYQKLLELAEDPDTDAETLADTLEALGGEIEDKADNYARVMKSMERSQPSSRQRRALRKQSLSMRCFRAGSARLPAFASMRIFLRTAEDTLSSLKRESAIRLQWSPTVRADRILYTDKEQGQSGYKRGRHEKTRFEYNCHRHCMRGPARRLRRHRSAYARAAGGTD